MTKLRALAHGRTGDKGDVSCISVIAWREEDWPLILREVTAERAARRLGFDPARTERYELPGLRALNFVFRGALAGGVTRSLALDAHGKCLSSLLLDMEVQAPDGDPAAG